MSYIDENLIADEKVLYRTQRHWIVFLPGFAWLVLAYILYRLPGTLHLVSWMPLVIGLLVVIAAAIDYKFSELAVTNQRVIIKIGFIYRDSIEIFLDNIAALQVRQNILGRILDYGTLFINDTGNLQAAFAHIDDPLSFRRAVHEASAR